MNSTADTWRIDRARAALLRMAEPWFGSLYADRERRVQWMAVFSIITSLALTVVAPLWLLALGPVLLGVPHLVADARYLVIQPGLHKRGGLVWLAALPLVALGFGAPPFIGLLSVVPLVLTANATVKRKLVALAVWAALTLVALRWETPFLLAFLHLHNVIALAWWWAWQPRSRRHWFIPVLTMAALAFLMLGGAEPVLTFFEAWNAPRARTSFGEFVSANAPGLSPTLALRLVLTFAFLQSLHYAVWLRLVPEDARARPAPRPFRESWNALVRDFGVPALAFCGVLAIFIAVWGVVDLSGARYGYLRLAAFHGYLELAVAAWFLVEGRRPVPC
ncbi:MAG: hypothetical protein DI536_00255 [Archangium gephyra]|uniref:Uncharacterized protein n=1 Tax=Archangium gephyra TaxID=48 RepID=A0A2W5TYR7_9BACT|nr:MAG: hypothetical protein DI536_00255 [Archangium gephyra]